MNFMTNHVAFLLLFVLVSVQLNAQQTTIFVNADQGRYTINKNIYGHFAEHLGRCIYGGFYVGEGNDQISNREGVRTDIIEALKELKVPVLRWPGGCFADTYHWMDGIGPKGQRPTLVNTWWGGVTEDNSFGTHDFLNLCEAIGAEPYLAANVGSGEVRELADWVQYVNHDGESPMADLRRENGRAEPWNVKYWGVGNEMWGCGGNMTPEYYANLYRQYATFMTDWSNSSRVFRIASGASEDDYHWTEVLMRDVKHNLVEALALHSYSVIDWSNKGPDVGFTEEQYFQTMKKAWRMEELVTKHSTIMDKYDPEKKIALAVDEWGGWYDGDASNGTLFQQNTMRDAMIAGVSLNIFHNHADRVRMANIAQTVNVLQAVILTKDEKMVLTPTYYVMKLFNVHQDATLLPIEIFHGAEYAFRDEQLPAISCSASKSETGNIHISLVNIDANTSNAIELDIRGSRIGSVTGTIIQSDNLDDHNSFDQDKKIAPAPFTDFEGTGEVINVTLPPFSVVLLILDSEE